MSVHFKGDWHNCMPQNSGFSYIANLVAHAGKMKGWRVNLGKLTTLISQLCHTRIMSVLHTYYYYYGEVYL